MPRQSGPHKIRGTVDDLTYKKTKFGYIIAEKSSLTGERVKTDPTFLLTRQNGSEFGRACKGGGLIRNSISDILKKSKDSNLVIRMVKKLMQIIKADTTNPRGQRTIQDGDFAQLKDFDFNIKAPMSQTFTAPNTTTLDRAAGTVTVAIAPFVPVNKIAAPASATHFRIEMAANEYDFANKIYLGDSAQTAILPLDTTATAPVSQVLTITAGSVLPVAAVVGIVFYELVNGDYWEMSNHSYNTLAVTLADV
jgi:hypothetical protein